MARVAVAGVIAGLENASNAILWVAYGFFVVLTFGWVLRTTPPPSIAGGESVAGAGPAWTQAAISTFAFAVWVFALGGPFLEVSWYEPGYGSLAIIASTLLLALIVPKDQ